MMPLPLLLIGGAALITSVTALVKVASDEAEDTAKETIPAAASGLAVLVAVGLGAWAAWRIIAKGKL